MQQKTFECPKANGTWRKMRNLANIIGRNADRVTVFRRGLDVFLFIRNHSRNTHHMDTCSGCRLLMAHAPSLATMAEDYSGIKYTS
jgi:hypothetical protein